MSKQASKRGIQLIIVCVAIICTLGVFAIDGKFQPKDSPKGTEEAISSKPHEFVKETAESMWAMGIVSCVFAIILIGFMGAELERLSISTKEQLDEARRLVLLNKTQHRPFDANS